MGLSDNCCLAIMLCVTVIPVTIMQGIGCFTPLVLKTEKCGNLGLYSHCCFDPCKENKTFDKYNNSGISDFKGPRKISDQAFICQVLAFVASFLLSAASFFMFRKEDDDENVNDKNCWNILGSLLILLYPIAGILCLTGCGLVANSDNRPENSTLGAAFYLFLLAGIYIIIQCAIVFGLLIIFGQCISLVVRSIEQEFRTRKEKESGTYTVIA